MSENSDTMQIRTDDPAAMIAKLRQTRFAGFVFRGTEGWLTAVPYGGPEGLAGYDSNLHLWAERLETAVMLFQFNDDFGWSFSLSLRDGRETSFTGFYDTMKEELAQVAAFGGPPVGAGPMLDEVLGQVVSLDKVRPFLKPWIEQLSLEATVDGFARALGFAQYRWLSPFYVVDDPGDAIRRGGEAIGAPPPPPH